METRFPCIFGKFLDQIRGVYSVARERDPVREWREHYARSCLNLDFKPLTDAPFHAAVVPILPVFQELRIVRTALSPGAVFRDDELVRDGDDNFGFLISQSRELDAVHQGHEVQLGLGDATMMQASATGSLGSHESFGFIEVMIPPVEWDVRGARPHNALMRRLSRVSDGMKLLRAYIRSLETMKLASFDGDEDTGELVSRHIIDLVVLAATVRKPIGESNASAVVAARRLAVLSQIRARFREPDLAIASVAGGLGISPRYLQRLLETSGRSFISHLNELRLQEAFRLLTTSKHRIIDIALAVGFSDISHFNRLFRSRFGDTPSSVRDGRAELR